MDLLKNATVKEYISSLDGSSPCYIMLNTCQCLKRNMPDGAHNKDAICFRNNSVELAVLRESSKIRSVVMYISKKSYFGGDSMKMLTNSMLNCIDVDTIDRFYYVINTNFLMHPPCAHYMNKEYENFILTPYKKCFLEMTLWDYLIDCLNKITKGSFLNLDGDDKDNKVSIYAIKKSFTFCVEVLQMDFEVSKKKNYQPLVLKCLKYNPVRKTRMHKMYSLLDKLFKNMKDFKMPAIHLAMLINQFN